MKKENNLILIIKEYLLQLKEKDELDILLCDLLLQKGYKMDTRPKTGNRQYGVDIHAKREKNTYLLVVKQGNIDRKIWDGDQNAIRQSLDEIKDVYLNNMTTSEKENKIKIIVATNGTMDESIRMNWNGYINSHSNFLEYHILYEFWGIDEIASQINECLLNEFIFDKAMHSNLRKALYLVDENEYKTDYYERIIDYYIHKIIEDKAVKKKNKIISSMYLISQMIAQYAAEYSHYKISIMISEYLMIKFWRYMIVEKLFQKDFYINWLLKFIKSYDKWNDLYYDQIKVCCYKKNVFPIYHVVEQRVMIYEVIGFLTSYAYFCDYIRNKQKAQEIMNSIICLINNNPAFLYPSYDSDITVTSILYRTLIALNNEDEVRKLIQIQTLNLMYRYNFSRKFPSPSDNFEEALKIENGNHEVAYLVSGMWGNLLEWIVVLEEKTLYNRLYEFLHSTLKETTMCVWYYNAEEEVNFYQSNAMNKIGAGVAVLLELEFEKFCERVNLIRTKYENEKYSYKEYSFSVIELIACRYFGLLPRIKVSEKI